MRSRAVGTPARAAAGAPAWAGRGAAWLRAGRGGMFLLALLVGAGSGLGAYTTKLLRRGTDIDRTTPWRALSDLKIADAMRPFRPPLPVPPADGGANGDGGAL